MLRDPLPRGADVISLMRVLHDHDDESARCFSPRFMTPCRPAARLSSPSRWRAHRGAEPMGDAYFGFYLLAMGRGRPRTIAEIAQLLTAAGFEAGREAKTRKPLVVSAFMARRV